MKVQEALEHLHGGGKVKGANGNIYSYDSQGLLFGMYTTNSTYREILQPRILEGNEPFEIIKKTKKVKVWQFIKGNGRLSELMYTENLISFWNGKSMVSSPYDAPEDKGWVKTQRWEEIEVEE